MGILENYLFESTLLLRIFLACFAGLIIGQERENKNRFAGVRTHIIVSLGSCLGVMVSIYGFVDTSNYDTSRVASQIISGIGFLGAGVIFVRGDVVTGLTTAAGMWTTSIIGMSFGVGMYLVGTVATILVFLVQGFFIEKKIFSKSAVKVYNVFIKANDINFWKDVDNYMENTKHSYKTISKSFSKEELEITLELYIHHGKGVKEFIEYLNGQECVEKFEIL